MNKSFNTNTITAKLADSHQDLSPLALDFVHYAAENSDVALPLQVPEQGHSMFVTEYEFDCQLMPFFMTNTKANAFGEVAVNLWDIYQKHAIKLANTAPDTLNQYFESQCNQTPAQLLSSSFTGLDDCMLRGDFIKSDGALKLLEFNVSGNIGGWQIFLFEPIYRQQPAIKAFMESTGKTFTAHNPLQHHVLHIIKRTKAVIGLEKTPHIVVYLAEAHRLESARDITARTTARLAEAGIAIKYTCITSAEELSLVDDKIQINGEVVDSMILYHYKNELPEFVNQQNEKGLFPLFDSRAAEMLGQKSGLVLLSEYSLADECPVEHKLLIDNHVPWTRFVRQEQTNFQGKVRQMGELLLSEKDNFVLKPVAGYQGIAVSVGNRIEQEKWQAIVEQALKTGGYIVQQVCESEQFLALSQEGQLQPHDAIWAPFIHGGEFAGNYVRLSPSDNPTGVINAHRGASDAMVFLYDE